MKLEINNKKVKIIFNSIQMHQNQMSAHILQKNSKQNNNNSNKVISIKKFKVKILNRKNKI